MTDTLSRLRRQIDSIDAEMMTLLARREAVVAEVLAHKQSANIPARIPERIDEVINNAAARAEELGANSDLARTVWSAMVEWFVRHEEKTLGRG